MQAYEKEDWRLSGYERIIREDCKNKQNAYEKRWETFLSKKSNGKSRYSIIH